MKKVILQRAHKGHAETLGMITVEGIDHKPIFTLELPWKQNKQFISCIPAGHYTVDIRTSKRFGKCYEICVVEGRTDVLIHRGNYPKNTTGCVLLGMGSSQGYVWSSRKAMKYFKNLLNYKKFTLEVRD